jgi:uncharacterized membrane protein YdjX (TVP38/TMEM64 family)
METPTANNNKPPFSIARFVPLLILGAGLIAFFALGLNKYLTLDLLRENREVLKTWVYEHKTEAVLLFITAYIITAAFSLPIASLVSITGGFLFGNVFGTAWGVLGATIGATILFVVAKSALGDPMRVRFASQIKSMEEGFRANAFSYLLLLRLVPLFPFWLVNLAAAFTGVSLITFVITTFVGIIPGAFVFASIGNGINALFEAGEQPDLSLFTLLSQPAFYIPIIGLAVLSLIPIVYRAFAPKKA